MINRKQLLHNALLAVVGSVITIVATDPRPAAAKSPKDDIYAPCAKACADCEKKCTACNKHCAGMIRAGMKEHERSYRLSADCRELCASAAKIVARRGPLSVAVCTACAEACEKCGAECGKYPDMTEMKACAVSCDVCAKACRTMIAQLKGKQT